MRPVTLNLWGNLDMAAARVRASTRKDVGVRTDFAVDHTLGAGI